MSFSGLVFHHVLPVDQGCYIAGEPAPDLACWRWSRSWCPNPFWTLYASVMYSYSYVRANGRRLRTKGGLEGPRYRTSKGRSAVTTAANDSARRGRAMTKSTCPVRDPSDCVGEEMVGMRGSRWDGVQRGDHVMIEVQSNRRISK